MTLPSFLPILLLLLGAVALALLAYGGLERLLPTAWLPALCRATAWFALGLLLLNPGCPAVGDSGRSLVLLDGSLSMTAAGGRWEEGRRVAGTVGDVRLFGDPDMVLDSLPVAGRSLLGPALEAAVATGRPVTVVTDGEIGDAAGLSASLLGPVAVRLVPRPPDPHVAVRVVQGPGRVTARDSFRVRVELVTTRLDSAQDVGLTARVSDESLASVRVRLPAEGATVGDLVVPPGRLRAGTHVLTIGLDESLDAEPRDDARRHLVTVSATPGIVVVGSPGDWEARTLYRVLGEVTDLPVEGFVELAPGQWRRFADLAVVDFDVVRRALAGADLAVVRGATALARHSGGRALLSWPAAAPDDRTEGDWYVTPGAGPVAGALAGMPVESLPPAVALASLPMAEGDWVGLSAQAARRGAVRPVLTGGIREGRRHVTVGAEGLWRWAFRGGVSEQAYRALFGAAVDWLLAAPDSARGRARPVQAVAPRGRPVVFAWTGAGGAEPVPIRLTPGAGPSRQDTLRFDGSGRAHLALPPGQYRYALEGGGEGMFVVDDWSAEWFPAPVTLAAREAATLPAVRRRGLRDRLWIFGLLVAALSTEWFVRRRRGLR